MIYRYRTQQTKTENFGSFFALLPPKKHKNQNFKNMKKMLEVSSFYKCVPKTTIIWGTIPELWSKRDIIFCDFVPFFAFLPPQRLRKAIFWYNEKSIWRCHHSTPGVSVRSLMVGETNSLVGYHLMAKGYSIQLGVWGVLWAAQQVQGSTLVRV